MLRLSKSARRLLTKRRTLKLVVKVVLKGGGASRSHSHTLVVKAPRTHHR